MKRIGPCLIVAMLILSACSPAGPSPTPGQSRGSGSPFHPFHLHHPVQSFKPNWFSFRGGSAGWDGSPTGDTDPQP